MQAVINASANYAETVGECENAKYLAVWLKLNSGYVQTLREF